MTEKISNFARLCGNAARVGALKNVVFHTPADKTSERLKVKGTLKNIGGDTVLQLEAFLTEGRVTHDNVSATEAESAITSLMTEFKKADLTCKEGNASLMISKKGDKATLVKHGKLDTAPASDVPDGGNNRRKKHVLTGDEVFLTHLGISDKDGRVRDKMQSKFRQINRFCEYISEAMNHIPPEGTVYIADLCCGKSYLSFAAYHTVRYVFGRECVMYCVDLKKSVIDYCAEIAEKCAYDGMKFFAMDINKFIPERAPHMVISLHACDVATDIVLDAAIRCAAEVILSTPCCHHELNSKLDCESLSFIGKRPLLRQKLCSAATDALRLMRLEAAGYETDATELIDPEDTPKNIMLRGYLKKGRSEKKLASALEEYKNAYRFMYGYDPAPLPEKVK
ncbi:MAG: SAM-dependent methyltransferase [Clostridia bacterium]|nr:SAM-dependent methyltransferase [Clostridia bacterium]